MRTPGRVLPSMLLVGLFVLTVGASEPGAAAGGTLLVAQGVCTQVQAGDSSTGAGPWSFRASGPFELTVRGSSNGYAYGPAIASDHGGAIPGPNNYFYTACNVCPVGDLTIDFSVPPPILSGSGQQFDANQFPHDLTSCDAGGFGGFGDIDNLAGAASPILGPLAFVAALASLMMVLAGPRHNPASGSGLGSLRAFGRTQTHRTGPGGPTNQFGPAGPPYQAGPAGAPPAGPPQTLPPFIGSESAGQPMGGIGVHVGMPDVPPAPTSPDYARPPPGYEPRCWLHGVPCAVRPSPVGPGWYSRTAWWCPVAPPVGHYPWGPTYPEEWLAAQRPP